MFIVAWLIFFGLLFWFFHYYTSAEEGTYEVNHGTVTITPDGRGHYYIDGTINNYPVKFMLDTGATLVAVPQGVAEKMRLRGRYSVTMETASGKVTGSLARAEELSFAGFTLRNVKVVIVPGADERLILLGMNVLSQFELSQKDKRLILRKE
nr:retropepsin-like aspartic protease [Legionella sp. PL877]